ncbi:hypothetical protein BVY05_16785 [Pectobacterium odoriferum]|nr:hypothetical protein BVY05_16785 [Pectobacterium odoriferum]
MLKATNNPSYFKLHVRWLRSLTRITYLSKLIGIPSLAAFLKLELFRVLIGLFSMQRGSKFIQYS